MAGIVVTTVYEREMGKVRVEVTLGLLLAFAWLWSLFSDLFHGFGFAKYTTSLLEWCYRKSGGEKAAMRCT